jgi:maltose O-acetyltransferase
MTINKLYEVCKDEMVGVHPRLIAAQILTAPFPVFTGNRVRGMVLRALGFQFGRKCILFGLPRIIGGRGMEKRLRIGDGCLFSIHCFLDASGPITIGDNTAFGPEVMLITGKHEIGDRMSGRMGTLIPEPITIGKGCWLGARVMVLPGVTIGDYSVIAAGAVVSRDIPPNSVAAGVPAKVIRELD